MDAHLGRSIALLSLAAVVLGAAADARASYAVYVGKNLTADGSVLVGGTGEEVSSHWLEVVPRREHQPGSTIRVGATEEANIPGKLIEIPQARETFRYLTVSYTDYLGFPPPLTNGGLNEYQVAVRDVWSPSRKELKEMTPTPQQGPQYSDLARIALERARTAREAVEIVGALIDRYGYTTYGGNSHLFADPEEGWVMIEYAGGRGLWAAERLGPDDVRVSYPGYIGEVPDDYAESPDFDGSPNLISFAIEQGWYDPASGQRFDAHQAYGAQGKPMRSPGIKFVDPKTLEEELRAKAGTITVQDIMAWVRDYRIADDEAGCGQVAHLRNGLHPQLALLWVAPTGAITAPFVPFYLGTQSIPPEYAQHRYLTKRAGATFLHPDYAVQEATQFAARIFKRLLYYTCERPGRFLPEVTEALTAFEARSLEQQPEVEQTVMGLVEREREDLAWRYMTEYSARRAAEGLDLGRALLASIEARTKVLFGIRAPEGDDINTPTHDTVNCRTGVDGETVDARPQPRLPRVEPHAWPRIAAATAATSTGKTSSLAILALIVAVAVSGGLGFWYGTSRRRAHRDR